MDALNFVPEIIIFVILAVALVYLGFNEYLSVTLGLIGAGATYFLTKGGRKS